MWLTCRHVKVCFALILTSVLCTATEEERTQASILVELYATTGGKNWTKCQEIGKLNATSPMNVVCSISQDCVFCNNENTQIQRLEIMGAGMMGLVPTVIGNLTSLQLLDLDHNSLHGGIPDTLCSLSQLQNLYIQSNKLNGSLNPCMTQLQSLETLALGDNKFAGELPEFLCSLTNLSSMVLNRNEFEGPIPACLGNMPNLQWIDLMFNHFGGIIPDTLCNANLNGLQLNKNELKGSIPHCIGNLTELLVLDFGLNQLNGTIPESICNLRQLEEIKLEDNQLTGGIPECIGQLYQTMEKISLSANKLNGTLPKSICGLINLLELQVENNTLIGHLPECLGNLSSLTLLNVGINNFTGTIPESFCEMTELQVFDTGINNLHGPVLDCLHDMSNLKYLSIETNHFQSNKVREMSAFCNLKNLRFLKIGQNDFDPQPIPPCFGQMTNMTHLNLRNISWYGEIPRSIYTLPDLQFLFISSATGKLSGELPKKGVENGTELLPSLQQLLLPNCGLYGPIPPWIMERTKETMLYILFSGNRVEGEIPTLPKGSRLIGFGAAGNLLTGTLDPFKNATMLEALDVSYNRIRGIFHSWLADRTVNMTQIRLTDNMFSCTLPQQTTVNKQVPNAYLEVLLGNNFGCPVPPHVQKYDSASKSYQCGSSALWYASYFAASAAVMIVLFVSWSHYKAWSRRQVFHSLEDRAPKKLIQRVETEAELELKQKKKKESQNKIIRKMTSYYAYDYLQPQFEKIQKSFLRSVKDYLMWVWAKKETPNANVLGDLLIHACAANTFVIGFILLPLLVVTSSTLQCRYGWILTASNLVSYVPGTTQGWWVWGLMFVTVFGSCVLSLYVTWHGISCGVIERVHESWGRKKKSIRQLNLAAQIEYRKNRKRAPLQLFLEELPKTISRILAFFVGLAAIGIPIGLNIVFVRAEEASSERTSTATKHGLVYAYAVMHEAIDTFIAPTLVYIMLALLSPPLRKQTPETEERKRKRAYRWVVGVELVNSQIAPIIALMLSSSQCIKPLIVGAHTIPFDMTYKACNYQSLSSRENHHNFNSSDYHCVYLPDTLTSTTTLPPNFDGIACLSALIKLYTPAYLTVLALRCWWVTIHMALIHNGISWEFFLAGTSTLTSAVTQIEGSTFSLNTFAIGLCAGMLSPILAIGSWLVLMARFFVGKALHRLYGPASLAKLPGFSPMPADCIGALLFFQTAYGAVFLNTVGELWQALFLVGLNIIAFIAANYFGRPHKHYELMREDDDESDDEEESKHPLKQKLLRPRTETCL
eukprot:m.38362 g.38362  ORF g.38362 m.38362 type:complete len:1279 (+) comp9422_c0_seq1:34-3870(+)